MEYLPHIMLSLSIVVSFVWSLKSTRFLGGLLLVPGLAVATFGLGWWEITDAASYHLPPLSGLLAMYFVNHGFPIFLSVANAYLAYYFADFLAMLDFARMSDSHWTTVLFGIGGAEDVPDALYVMTVASLVGCFLVKKRREDSKLKQTTDI